MWDLCKQVPTELLLRSQRSSVDLPKLQRSVTIGIFPGTWSPQLAVVQCAMAGCSVLAMGLRLRLVLPCRQQHLAMQVGAVVWRVSMLSMATADGRTATLWPCSHQRGEDVAGAMQDIMCLALGPGGFAGTNTKSVSCSCSTVRLGGQGDQDCGSIQPHQGTMETVSCTQRDMLMSGRSWGRDAVNVS